jgi:hypothetical protein
MRRSRVGLRLGLSLAVVVGVQVAVAARPAFAGTLTPNGGSLTLTGYVDGTAQTLAVGSSNNPAITTSNTCSASPGNCTWSVTSGSLPAGLSITANPANFGTTAYITGTPTAGVTTSTGVTLTQTGGTGGTSSASFNVSVIETLTSAGGFGGNGQFPTATVANFSTKQVYSAAFNSNSVDVINATVNPPVVGSSRLLAFLAGQLNSPFGMVVYTGTSTFYVGNFKGGNEASILTAGTGPATESLGSCSNPAGAAQDSSPQAIWVACAGSGTVVVLNPTNNTVSATINLAPTATAAGCTSQPVPSGVAQTSNNGTVVVADARCNLVYKLSTTAVMNTVALPSGAYAANMVFANNGGQFAYVAEPGLSQIQQINTNANPISITATQSTPGCIRPYGVATSSLSTGSILGVACAGTTSFTSPSVAFFNLGSGSNFNLRFTVPLPNGLVPDGMACVPGTVLLCFTGTSFGNSVVVVDPPSGHHKVRLNGVSPSPATRAAAAAAVTGHHPLIP